MPADYYQIGGERVSYRARFLGGTACNCGTAGTVVTIETGATCAVLMASGGDIYYELNGTAAAGSVASGYVPQDDIRVVPVINNLISLWVVGSAAASIAHVQQFEA